MGSLAGPSRARRNSSIELLRISAAFGIVWFHAREPGGEIAYAGLPIFLIIALYFQAGSTRSATESLHRMVKQIAIPWMIWMIVFALINVVRHKPPIPLDHGLVRGVLEGSYPHLWYLPFFAAVSVLLILVRKRLSRTLVAVMSAVLACGILVSAPEWRPWSLSVGYPVVQWMQALPAVFIGIALTASPRIRWPFELGVLTAMLVLVGYPGLGVTYILAFTLVWIAVELPDIPVPAGMIQLSSLTYGIFLCHPIFLTLLHPIERVSWVAYPVAVFFSSAVAVYGWRIAVATTKSWRPWVAAKRVRAF